jgi:hypothetical protein
MNLDLSSILAAAKKINDDLPAGKGIADVLAAATQPKAEYIDSTVAESKESVQPVNTFISTEPVLSFPIDPAVVGSNAGFADGNGEVSPQVLCATAQSEMDKSKCWHMCSFSGCQNFWTHGDIAKCRFPDILNQGLCPNCLNGEQNTFGEDFFQDERGNIRLAPERIKQVTNKERLSCANMTIEQLTNHILYHAKHIAEIQAAAMTARKMRADKEEEALLDIPESEREAFRQTLRRGAAEAKKPRTLKAPKESAKDREAKVMATLGDLPPAVAKMVAKCMLTMSMTREQAEAFIND